MNIIIGAVRYDAVGGGEGQVTRYWCNICESAPAMDGRVETAAVRSNVRAFAREVFQLWRCPTCRTIHSQEDVDLDRYYASYPMSRRQLDWLNMVAYGHLVRRLRFAGVKKHHRILDYGCGSGTLIEFLTRRGYTRTVGYDPYVAAFSDKTRLDGTYDVVLLQDVVEHVENPRGLLLEMGRRAGGGWVAISTPDAGAIDLTRVSSHVHSLHQPYHRHILSRTALANIGRDLRWTLVREYHCHYADTPLPFLNFRFFRHYAACFDDTMDLAVEPVRLNRQVLTPRGVYLAFAGHWVGRSDEMMMIFRS